MSHLFFDSSALIKRYIVEVGMSWVRSITAGYTGNILLVAHITQAEVVSSLMRRKRERTISEQIAHSTRLLLDLEMTQDNAVVVTLTDSIVHRAENLLEQYSLRA